MTGSPSRFLSTLDDGGELSSSPSKLFKSSNPRTYKALKGEKLTRALMD